MLPSSSVFPSSLGLLSILVVIYHILDPSMSVFCLTHDKEALLDQLAQIL